MEFIEEKNDLFSYEGKAWLAHCISADFGMGKGISTQFNDRYNMKNYLLKNYFKDNWTGQGYCLPVKQYQVFNLVTKDKYYNKPTYKSLRQSLADMKNYAATKGIDTIVIPYSECESDGLFYPRVIKEIQNVFINTDIKIIVCELPEGE